MLWHQSVIFDCHYFVKHPEIQGGLKTFLFEIKLPILCVSVCKTLPVDKWDFAFQNMLVK